MGKEVESVAKQCVSLGVGRRLWWDPDHETLYSFSFGSITNGCGHALWDASQGHQNAQWLFAV